MNEWSVCWIGVECSRFTLCQMNFDFTWNSGLGKKLVGKASEGSFNEDHSKIGLKLIDLCYLEETHKKIENRQYMWIDFTTYNYMFG